MPSDKDIVEEVREFLNSIDRTARVGYAFELLRALTDEAEQLRKLVVAQAEKQRDDSLVRAAEDQDYNSEQRASLAKELEQLRAENVSIRSRCCKAEVWYYCKQCQERCEV